MPSCKAHVEVVSNYPAKETKEGHIAGSFAPHTLPGLHKNRFGVIPKKHQPAKWRLITDIPYPDGKSVNDLRLWSVFSTHWNGAALLLPPCSDLSTAITITFGASGSWGCGEWSGSAWFQLQWDQPTSLKQIATKELIPIIIAAVVWGHTWTGNQVQSLCDNEAVVTVINSRSSREQDIMQLLRCLFFLESHFQFYLIARHLLGLANTLADDLSRNRLSSFCTHHTMLT